MDVVLAGGVHHHTNGAFSGRVMWADMTRRVPEFRFAGWAPSPVAAEIPRHKRVCQADRHGLKVSHSFRELVRQSVETNGPDNTLACIAVDTDLHVQLIQEAVEAGARFIWSDKPIVVKMTDLQTLLELCAKNQALRIFGAQNHRYCASALLQRQEAQRALREGRTVDLRTGFWQAWLLGDQESRQALSRLLDFRTTLADLGAHDFDLEEFILGMMVQALFEGVGLHGLTGKFANNFTGGTCKLEFADPNATGSIDVDQCREDALMDDLWSWLKIEGEQDILWRMGRHGGNSVCTAKINDPDMLNRDDWNDPVEFGSSAFGKVSSDFPGWSPPGHDPHCWPNMWRTHAMAILGEVARILGLEIAKQGLLPPHMCLPVPEIRGTGRRTAQYINAHVKSARLCGARVELADVA